MSPPNDLGEPTVTRTAARGELQIWNPAPHVVVTRVSGHFPEPFAAPIMAAIDETVRAYPSRAVACHDWTTVGTFDVRVPATMTPWSVTVFRKLERVVIGVSSPIVAAAVRTVNLAVGGRFEVLDTPEAIYAAAREAAAQPA